MLGRKEEGGGRCSNCDEVVNDYLGMRGLMNNAVGRGGIHERRCSETDDPSRTEIRIHIKYILYINQTLMEIVMY